jgi:hypothetical protein
VRTGTCPKCKSTNVYAGTNVFPKSGPFGSNSIPVSLTSIAALDNYVCIDCGYLESYVEEEKLEEIARKWKKAGATAPAEDEPA